MRLEHGNGVEKRINPSCTQSESTAKPNTAAPAISSASARGQRLVGICQAAKASTAAGPAHHQPRAAPPTAAIHTSWKQIALGSQRIMAR
jgi:hypothetical protein